MLIPPLVLDPPIVNRVLRACIQGLDDYTTDERGDVGSWIRVACIRGLCLTVEVLFSLAPVLEVHRPFKAWISPETYQEVLGGILKQGVERLDNVRRQAGESFLKLLGRDPPKIEGDNRWRVEGESLIKQLFFSDDGEKGWYDGQWLFPKAVHILEVSEYRKPVLYGLVLSIGSKTDSTQRPVAQGFTEYVGSLPVCSDGVGKLDLLTVIEELLDLARGNILSNHIVVPVLQTFDLILDAGILDTLAEVEAGVRLLEAFIDISTKNVARLKNMQRILVSMKITNGLLAVACIAHKALMNLPQFLLHAFPKVRTATAENIYLVLQSKDLGTKTDEAEEIILETDWSAPVSELERKVEKLVSGLRRDLDY